MSIWTHVAGIVRIDDVRFLSQTDWLVYFGKECLFSDSSETWIDAEQHPDQYLPMGSEGSLQSSIWINPDENSLAAYTVMIFGDLRDYNTPEAILNWFKKKLEDVDISVRQAVITIECEVMEPIVYNYRRDDNGI